MYTKSLIEMLKNIVCIFPVITFIIYLSLFLGLTAV